MYATEDEVEKLVGKQYFKTDIAEKAIEIKKKADKINEALEKLDAVVEKMQKPIIRKKKK